jgi:hypothetical protein
LNNNRTSIVSGRADKTINICSHGTTITAIPTCTTDTDSATDAASTCECQNATDVETSNTTATTNTLCNHTFGEIIPCDHLTGNAGINISTISATTATATNTDSNTAAGCPCSRKDAGDIESTGPTAATDALEHSTIGIDTVCRDISDDNTINCSGTTAATSGSTDTYGDGSASRSGTASRKGDVKATIPATTADTLSQ